jgi:hypothetical protein
VRNANPQGAAMPQIFHRSFNTLSKVSIFGAILILAGVGWVIMVVYRSPYVTGSENALLQPVPFSHEHHAGKLGIDCRYCHGSVEESAFAGLPPTKTCMNCHSQIWVGSAMLEPIRASYRSDRSVQWQRIHKLPQFVYFDHSIHIHKGVGCVTCHGRVDRMPLTWQVESLQMRWCLECHREPERFVRPRQEVFNMNWQPAMETTAAREPRDQLTLGRGLVRAYRIQAKTSCSTCHR